MGAMTPQEKKEFYKRFDNLEKSILKIQLLLESNSIYNEKGLVEEVHDNSRRIDDFLMREKIYKAKAATWGIIGGSIITVIIWVAKLFLAKLL
jgi:hypothetical protein